MEYKKKVKVAYFVTIFYEILFARFAENFVRNLDNKKYTMSFVVVNAKESFKNKIEKNVFITNLHIPISLLKLPIMLFELIMYFKREKPDIFVSAAPLINTISIMAKVFSGVKTKVILTEHNVFSILAADVISPYKRFAARFILPYLMRIFYPMADMIVCVSKGVAEDISKVINYKDKIQVIYNPVISDEIYSLSEESVNHPWFSNLETPVILAAGRLVKQKDYPTLLRSFKIVFSKNPACRLVILGEGALRKELENISLELGIFEAVAFLGFVKNQYKYIKRASILVLSSTHEGFGNGIVDAMALGTPVVATDCRSGPNEIIEDRKNGILVPVGDYNALSDAILEVLGDFSLWQKLSIEGRKRAECFSFKNRVKEYEEVFQKIMDQN